MEQILIQETINRHIPAKDQISTKITLNQYNGQPELIQLLVDENFPPTFTQIGQLIDALNELIILDEYGDLVQFTLEFTSYHDHPTQEGNLCLSYTLTLGIDS